MRRARATCALLAGALSIGVSGCHHGDAPTGAGATTPATPAKAATPAVSVEQLQQAKVDETGQVPILEYHDVVPTENPKKYMRSQANFRKDLERLYAEGYRPVTLHEYLDNRIAIPIGTSPVVFTFDDARASQFRYLPDGSIDPDCAVGILQAFQAKHPDFVVKATFYILPDAKFGQPALAAKKIEALLAMGCEIGNHTVTHRALATLTDEEVTQELADCLTLTQKIDPQVKMDTVALPLGSWPHKRALLASGSYHGQSYANRAVMKVGAEPAPSPVGLKFNPMSLPRIQASEEPSASTFWLDILKRHPERRYVSDGDPATISVPRAQAEKLDKTKLNGATLRLY